MYLKVPDKTQSQCYRQMEFIPLSPALNFSWNPHQWSMITLIILTTV
jgi:hypothetical protein